MKQDDDRNKAADSVNNCILLIIYVLCAALLQPDTPVYNAVIVLM
jgi:hypothetical protein